MHESKQSYRAFARRGEAIRLWGRVQPTDYAIILLVSWSYSTWDVTRPLRNGLVGLGIVDGQ
jgi:hypothetical protein